MEMPVIDSASKFTKYLQDNNVRYHTILTGGDHGSKIWIEPGRLFTPGMEKQAKGDG